MTGATLTEDQLERLNNGESIEVSKQHGSNSIAIHPPCEVFDHEFLHPRVSDGRLSRTCARCGEEEEIWINNWDLAWALLEEAKPDDAGPQEGVGASEGEEVSRVLNEIRDDFEDLEEDIK